MLTPLRAIDEWLFSPGTAEDVRRCQRAAQALACVILLRVALGPYRGLAGQPPALFRPPALLSWLTHMPSVRVIIAIQAVGAVAAILAIVRPHRAALPLAWVSLVVLAGLRGSLGKILHNDLLLILATVPFVLHALLGRHPFGARWPIRGALVVITAAYFFAGYQKLTTSGLEWVFSDNFRWILDGGAASGRAPTAFVARFIAARPALSVASAGMLLAIEVTFPAVLFLPRTRRFYGVAAIIMHIGTWLTLGLDYWGWIAVDAIVLLYAAHEVRK